MPWLLTIAFFLVMCSIVAACAYWIKTRDLLTPAPVASAPMPEPQLCAADQMQSLVGDDISNHPELVRSKDLRILEPGSMVTMDYRADRMNIDTDEAGIITKVYCG